MRTISRKWTWIGRLWRDRRGVSAVEFALVVPLLLIVLLGGSELGIALTVDRKVKAMAGYAVDLVSQSTSLSESDLQKLFRISKGTIAPYSIVPLRMRVTQIKVVDGKGTVDWSCQTRGYDQLAKGSAIPIPDNLKAQGELLQGRLRERLDHGRDYAAREEATSALLRGSAFRSSLARMSGEARSGAPVRLASLGGGFDTGLDHPAIAPLRAPSEEKGRLFSHHPSQPSQQPSSSQQPTNTPVVFYILMGEASYDFRPVTGAVLEQAIVLSGMSYVLPRYSSSVSSGGCAIFDL
ncbi:TadE/TadG family type IV pilus assembly protein [Aureimonas sp. AU40]|uniref:TadE/TadG family type IV pilus assembly protein n=1 Tax=Aureimonas sp. AU40 TaxID=1637747 RepID=UPI0007822192|nr:TadE/TadG family type IV pilus assembly protein [Aureimonas sp. AU40]